MKKITKTFKRVTSLLISALMLLNMVVIVSAAEKTVDAKMYWSSEYLSTDSLDWKDVETENAGKIFDIADFEPGSEAIRYIKIENAGDLAFSYALNFVSDEEAGSLAEIIDVYYLGDVTETVTVSDMTSVGTLADVINGDAVSDGKMLPAGLTEDGVYTENTVVAIALKMNDNAANEYLGTSAGNFTIELNATECDYDGYPSVDKFSIVFENTNDYLYRVGNVNTVKLGSLFKALDSAEIGNVTVAIESLDTNTNVSGTFTANSSDWTASTIQFSGTGPVKVTIDDDDFANELSLNLEVIDATNVTAYSELGNKNSVLLSDITMNSGGSFYLSNATLYGNGFTFDVSNGAYNSSGYLSGNYLVSLTNANLDNIKITGAVYTQYGATRDVDYNRATVYSAGNNTISNSYISNCAAPIRVNGGNIEIINSTLKGGNFANLDIRNGHVTLDNVTTINQVNGNDTAADGTVVVGLGVVVYYENVLNTTTIEVVNGITQYNHLSETQANEYITDNTAKTLVSAMFDSDYSNVQYSDGSDTWINTGILSMTEAVGDDNITDVSDYKEAFPSMTGATGYLHTKAPTDESIAAAAPDYKSAGQYAIAPSYSFDYTTKNYVAKTDGSNDYCYEDNGTVLISMDEGDTVNWDTSILTATKAGQTLDYTVSMNGTDYTGKTIPFTTSGNYTVEYTYTDSNNYTIDENGNVGTYSKTYTKNVDISVSAIKPEAKNAKFTFGSSNIAAKTVTIGNDTYVMPNVSATSSTIGSTTVSGNTIYYPIVEMIMSDGKTSHSSSGWYAYFPILSGVVTITDYADGGTGDAVEYGASTTTMPSGLSVDGDPSSLFKYQSSSSAGTTPQVKNNILVYVSPKISAKRDEYNTVIKYYYKDNAGTTHYYYVGYHAPAQSYTSICVTPDTLITLADGSQKKIEDVTYDDELLTWDFFEGEYSAAPSSVIVDYVEEKYPVTTLIFEDSTELKLVGAHGVYDADLNQYVFIDNNNVDDYVGHNFVKNTFDENGNASKYLVKLVDYEVAEKLTKCYSLRTSQYDNCFAEGILTVTPQHIDEYYNIFEITDDMKYDSNSVKETIDTYGLYTYEDFSDYISEDIFIALNCAYFKIMVGKGWITFDEIIGFLKAYNLGYGENQNTVSAEPENTSVTNTEEQYTEPQIMLLSTTEETTTKSDKVTSAGNTISAASYVIGSTVENNVVTLTATGTATTGYAKITVDGESFYTVQIPQGESIAITLKNTENAKDTTVSVESFWGNSANYGISQVGLLADGSEIDFGTFTMTISGASAVLSNTTKYPVTGDVYLAVYDAEMRLITVKKENITVEGKNDYTYSPEITIPENATVKAFIWETDGMKPIIK